MADILTTSNRSNWETQARIRLIGEDDATLIPTATLGAFVEQAERVIKKRLVDGNTTITAVLANANNKEWVIDAALWLLCAMLCDPLSRLIAIKEKTGELSYEYQFDLTKTETACYGSMENCLGEISSYTAPSISYYDVVSPTTTMFESMEDD